MRRVFTVASSAGLMREAKHARAASTASLSLPASPARDAARHGSRPPGGPSIGSHAGGVSKLSPASTAGGGAFDLPHASTKTTDVAATPADVRIRAELVVRIARTIVPFFFALAGATAIACGSSESASAPSPESAGADAGSRRTTFGGARPVEIRVPAGYDASRPAPLLLALHGYGAGGSFNEIYMRFASIADEKGFFYVSPDGTRDKAGRLFWNATDECCDFDRTGVDDVGYLTSLVDEIRSEYAIDTKRIFVVGHSNGGYMANRLACDRADMFAAVVSFAGRNFVDATRCAPTAPVGFLQIHGTNDGSVPFTTAAGTTATWATKNGCGDALEETGELLRVDADSKAPDTKVARHPACAANGSAELWPVDGAGHIFTFTPEATSRIWSFLEDHAKP